MFREDYIMRLVGCLISILLIVLLVSGNVISQPNKKTAFYSIHENGQSFHLNLDGLLDAENTFTYPSSIAFEPMVRLSLENNGIDKIIYPRIIFNDQKNWFTIDSMLEEVFEGSTTDKEKALALWKFIRKNRIHRSEAERTNETNDPIKLFGVYGYGMCYNTNYSNTFIAKKLNGQARSFSPRNGRHFVSGISFDNNYFLIDGDIETFYLKSDNRTLASYYDIAFDKYLIQRTHHYGKAEEFNLYNDFVASSVYEPYPTEHYFGQLKEFHSLDFTLRPGEKIIYDWGPGELYHSYGSQHNAEPFEIANGKFIYNVNFEEIDLSDLLCEYNNVKINDSRLNMPQISAHKSDEVASFVIDVNSPFVILDAEVAGKFIQSNANAIEMLFSKDSIIWETVWKSEQIGTFNEAIELYDKIGTLTSNATYNYYLKFLFHPNDTQGVSGLDSLVISTDFQISRSFLPSLHLGDNVIKYSDTNLTDRNLDLKIEYQESFENDPPISVLFPIFPVDGAVVDSLTFSFIWNKSQDNDQIVDYEFQLSDRSDMKYPLSPSFQIYTSKIGGQPLNQFRIPYYGMLNSGQTYYWRVKAKDSKGVWSSWSSTWSFTPHGVMPPVNGSFEVRDASILLEWDLNGIGEIPAYYEIHASNEWLGFEPTIKNLLDTTSLLNFEIQTQKDIPNTFYRIVAVGSNGDKSGPSSVIELPYPYHFVSVDTLYIGSSYSLKLKTNKLRTKDVIQVENNVYWDTFIDDSVFVELLSKPEWLSFDNERRELSGVLNCATLNGDILPDSVVITIRFTGMYSGFSKTQNIFVPVKSHNPPYIDEMHTLAIINEEFNDSIGYGDFDTAIGDCVLVESVSVPSWMTYENDINQRTIVLHGNPQIENAGDTLVAISVIDLAGNRTTRSFPLQVNTDNENLFLIYPNPFTSEITLLFNSLASQKVEIVIFDINGKKILDSPYDFKGGLNKVQLNLHQVVSGEYLVIVNGQFVGTTQMVKRIMHK